MRVVALLAAYNEADVITQVIGDLIAQGLSVYLIDHSSTDDTAARAAVFLGRGLLEIENFSDEKFAWERLLARKEELARDLESDWFLHTDADELRESPFAARTLAEAIAEVDALGYNAIDFAVLNFAPVDDDFPAGGDLREHFQFYEPAQAFDRVQIKCWKKAADVELRSSGGHEARFAGRRVFPIRFLDRHYPVRTQAQGRRKVFVERKPRFVEEERRRGWHVQYDRLAPDCSFIRDRAELIRFDAQAARHALFEHNRALEAESQAALDQTRAALDHMRREQAAAAARVVELERQLAELREVERALRADLDGAREGEAEVRARLGHSSSELESARTRLREAEQRLDDLYSSPTWRLAAAVRGLYPFSGRR